MNLPYLLLAGSNFHPRKGTGDWLGRFATLEEAQKAQKEAEKNLYLECDYGYWSEIVDLREAV